MTDRDTRSAAVWATVIALPVAVLAGLVIFSVVSDRSPAAPRSAPATTTLPVPSGAVPSGAVPSGAVPGMPVPMAAPALSARAASICRAVLARLPGAVRELPRRAVGAGAAQNAAYGEPALTVACGVAQPVLCPSLEETRPGCVPLDTELLTMDRVCWYADRGSTANTFTTMGLEIPVRVTVPVRYEQAAQWANEFSAAVAAPNAPAPPESSGCA